MLIEILNYYDTKVKKIYKESGKLIFDKYLKLDNVHVDIIGSYTNNVFTFGHYYTIRNELTTLRLYEYVIKNYALTKDVEFKKLMLEIYNLMKHSNLVLDDKIIFDYILSIFCYFTKTTEIYLLKNEDITELYCKINK